MKLSLPLTLSFFGFSNVCRSEPLSTVDPTEWSSGTYEPSVETTDEAEAAAAAEASELQMIASYSNLVAESINALGGQDAISKAIIAVAGATQERRALEEDDDTVALLGGDAEEALSGVVEHWLDGLPEEMLGDETRRNLQGVVLVNLAQAGRSSIVRSIVRALACTILTIFADNILYSEVEDLDDYDDNTVCLAKDACPGTGHKTVKFVSENPKGNEFLYQDSGPDQLQGTFWLNYPGVCSSMVSFAETEEQYPLSTGQLRLPGRPLFPGLFSRLISDNYAYNIRVSGASNWAFTAGSFCYPAVKELDLIYGIKPAYLPWDPLFSPTDPEAFTIVPSIKVPFTDFRVSLDSDCTVTNPELRGFSILRFEMEYIRPCTGGRGGRGGRCGRGGRGGRGRGRGGCERIRSGRGYQWRRAYNACMSGAKVWRRDTYWLQSAIAPPTSTYYVIQIIDGDGEETSAYSKFIKNQKNTAGFVGERYPINEFRSLKSSKRSKCR